VLSTNDIDMMIEVIEILTPSVSGITSEECSSMNDNTCNSDDDHSDDDVTRAATPSGNIRSILVCNNKYCTILNFPYLNAYIIGVFPSMLC